MITIKNIKQYQGSVINGGENFLYIPPNILLRPYISHYCISLPTPQSMSDEYTVLPSANSVLGIFVKDGHISTSYDGTNSKASVVGAFANKKDLLLLIKFRAGGFFPFYGFNQNELVDCSLDLSCIDKALSFEIKNGLIKSKSIEDLAVALDHIFIDRLNSNNNDYMNAAINKIVLRKGDITTHELSDEFYYSEKHIRRMFLQQVGVSPKKFSRIVRINYALRLLKDNHTEIMDIVEDAGYYDQSHFIHDFKSIFSQTPSEYIKNMSVFYNAESF